jgi:hypothetical protein
MLHLWLSSLLLFAPPDPAPVPVVLPPAASAEYGELIDIKVDVPADAKAVKWRVIPGDAQIRWYPDKRICNFVARPKTDTVYSLIASTALKDESFDNVCEITVAGLTPGPAPGPGPVPQPEDQTPYLKPFQAAWAKDKAADLGDLNQLIALFKSLVPKPPVTP